MSIFEKIELRWDGKTYVIPADRVMPALVEIENVVTLHELEAYRRRGTFPMVKIAQAYGAVLRFAGCSATDEEIYAGMFKRGDFNVSQAVLGLLTMMVPSSAVSPGAASEGNGFRAEERSSKQRSRRRAASA